jgi:hypothetical protein
MYVQMRGLQEICCRMDCDVRKVYLEKVISVEKLRSVLMAITFDQSVRPNAFIYESVIKSMRTQIFIIYNN